MRNRQNLLRNKSLTFWGHLMVFKKSGGYFYFKEVVDMPFIAPELIIQAKQMDLLTYLKNYEPYELVKFSGNTYCTRTHDSLKISNGKWIWWSRGIGGRSALDYLIILSAKRYSRNNRVSGSVSQTSTFEREK